MVAKPDTMDGDDSGLTPAEVLEDVGTFRSKDVEEGESLLAAILTPRTRAEIIDVLVGSPGEELTAAQISERAGIDPGSFTRQKMALLNLGVMRRGEQVANAQTYALNREHPVAQLLGMLDQVLRFGTTSMLLEEQFVGTAGADYEPGDHPDDPRDS